MINNLENLRPNRSYRPLIQAGYLLCMDRDKSFQLSPPEQNIIMSKNCIQNLIAFKVRFFFLINTNNFSVLFPTTKNAENTTLEWWIMQLFNYMICQRKQVQTSFKMHQNKNVLSKHSNNNNIEYRNV